MACGPIRPGSRNLSERASGEPGGEKHVRFWDLFDLAGVDMTSPEVVRSAFKVMEENVDLMEKLIE